MQQDKCEDLYEPPKNGMWVTDERELSDAREREDREYRNIEINTNGVFLVDYKCGACGGKMMVGSLNGKVCVWCALCKQQMTRAALIKNGFNTFGSGI